MLRPPSADELLRLRGAASASDRELDRALSDVGVLPPLDLAHIRRILARPGADIGCSRNPDGHAIVEIAWNQQPSARIHHDGRVELVAAVAA